MPFFCPDCEKQLRGDYIAITDDQHGADKKCTGIGKEGVWGHNESKTQQKNKARVAGLAAADQHKKNQSVSNLNTYQTQHPNAATQRQREEKAKKFGVPPGAPPVTTAILSFDGSCNILT
jgi:hypothetical protein